MHNVLQTHKCNTNSEITLNMTWASFHKCTSNIETHAASQILFYCLKYNGNVSWKTLKRGRNMCDRKSPAVQPLQLREETLDWIFALSRIIFTAIFSWSCWLQLRDAGQDEQWGPPWQCPPCIWERERPRQFRENVVRSFFQTSLRLGISECRSSLPKALRHDRTIREAPFLTYGLLTFISRYSTQSNRVKSVWWNVDISYQCFR